MQVLLALLWAKTQADHKLIETNGFAWRLMAGAGSLFADCTNFELPSCRYFASVVDYNDRLFVFGGCLNDPVKGSQCYNDVWIFDRTKEFRLRDSAWSQLLHSDCLNKNLPECRGEHTAVVIGNEMLVYGGVKMESSSTSGKVMVSNGLWAFDLETYQWQKLKGLPALGLSHASHIAVPTGDGKMVIYGGTNYQKGFGTNLVVLYDRAKDSATVHSNNYGVGQELDKSGAVLCDADPKRLCVFGAQGGVYNGSLYIFGGQQYNTYPEPVEFVTNSLFRMSLTNFSDTELLLSTSCYTENVFCQEDQALPCCRMHHSLSVVNDVLIIFGGESPVSKFASWPRNDVWEYSITNQSWAQIKGSKCNEASPGPICTSGHRTVVVPRFKVQVGRPTMFLFGGRNYFIGYAETTNSLWAYNAYPKVDPNYITPGPTRGGTHFSVHGSNFFGLANLSFGYDGQTFPDCSDVIVQSTSIITAVSPAGVGSNIRVTVRLYSGVWFDSEPVVAFSYLPPSVYAVTLASDAPTSGGGFLTIRGSNFASPGITGLINVTMKARKCRVYYHTDNSIECFMPLGSGKDIRVVVQVGNQESSQNNQSLVSYDPPAITYAVFPKRFQTEAGTNGGGTLMLQGKNLAILDPTAGKRILVGNRDCAFYAARENPLPPDLNLRCHIPPGVGANLEIRVVIDGQISDPYKQDLFSYTPPKITQVKPMVITSSVTTEITIYGTNFGGPQDLNEISVHIGTHQCYAVSFTDDPTQPTIPKNLLCKHPVIDEEMVALVDVTVGEQSSRVLMANDTLAPYHVVVQFPPISDVMFTAVRLLAGVVFLLCLALLIFLIWARESKIIKASSPLFCYLIVLGTMVEVASLFFKDPRSYGYSFYSDHVEFCMSAYSCHISLFMLLTGYTIVYGSLVLKNWRIYKIFHNSEQCHLVDSLSNQYLIKIVACLLLVNWVLVLLFHFAAPPCNRFPDGLFTFKSGGFTAGLLASLLIGFNISILLAGIYIAIQSRVISLPEFSERHQVGYAIYNTFLILAVCLPLSVVLTSPQTLFAVRATGIMLSAVMTLGCIFLPKLVYMCHSHARRGSSLNNQLENSFRKGSTTNSLLNSPSQRLRHPGSDDILDRGRSPSLRSSFGGFPSSHPSTAAIPTRIRTQTPGLITGPGRSVFSPSEVRGDIHRSTDDGDDNDTRAVEASDVDEIRNALLAT